MKQRVFGVYDVKTGGYKAPFVMETSAAAIRAFYGLTIDPDSDLNKWPDDFQLYELGTFDTESGLISPLKQPHFLATARDALNNEAKS